MSIWIIYGLVIVFLLAFPLFVLAFVQAPEASTQVQQGNVSTARVDKLSYGLVLAFFVLFALLTFVVRRNNS
ncbi:MAG: hypothetical protein H0V70_24240 [Ktedonobacteraceae bacterium]|nr:hypothetical protein [Ktedonobacteraceae bacterium]